MPLVPAFTDGRPPVPAGDRPALWFWARVEGADPVQPVCVFVSYETLWGFDPSQLRDVYSALAIFEANRARIEEVASAQFDLRGGDQGDQHQGQPVLTLRAQDFQ